MPICFFIQTTSATDRALAECDHAHFQNAVAHVFRTRHGKRIRRQNDQEKRSSITTRTRHRSAYPTAARLAEHSVEWLLKSDHARNYLTGISQSPGRQLQSSVAPA